MKLNGVRKTIIVAMVVTFACSVQNFLSAQAGKEKNKPEKINSIDFMGTSIIWHLLRGSEMTQAEMLKVFDLNLSQYDEFTRRKVLDETKKTLNTSKQLLSRTTEYIIIAEFELGEYDFDKSFFPTGITAGKQLVAKGNYFYDLNELLEDSDIEPILRSKRSGNYLKYELILDLSQELESVAMAVTDAEKLSPRLQNSRKIELKMWIEPKLALPTEDIPDTAVPSISRLHRRINCQVNRAELSLGEKKGYRSGKEIIIFPRKILKVWTM